MVLLLRLLLTYSLLELLLLLLLGENGRRYVLVDRVLYLLLVVVNRVGQIERWVRFLTFIGALKHYKKSINSLFIYKLASVHSGNEAEVLAGPP
jgi:hypothetical protein